MIRPSLVDKFKEVLALDGYHVFPADVEEDLIRLAEVQRDHMRAYFRGGGDLQSWLAMIMRELEGIRYRLNQRTAEAGAAARRKKA